MISTWTILMLELAQSGQQDWEMAVDSFFGFLCSDVANSPVKNILLDFQLIKQLTTWVECRPRLLDFVVNSLHEYLPGVGATLQYGTHHVGPP